MCKRCGRRKKYRLAPQILQTLFYVFKFLLKRDWNRIATFVHPEFLNRTCSKNSFKILLRYKRMIIFSSTLSNMVFAALSKDPSWPEGTEPSEVEKNKTVPKKVFFLSLESYVIWRGLHHR